MGAFAATDDMSSIITYATSSKKFFGGSYYGLSQEYHKSSPGSFSVGGYSPADTLRPFGATSIHPCKAGFYSNAGNTGCTPCPSGTYTDKVSSTACVLCPAGKSSDSGKSVCDWSVPSGAPTGAPTSQLSVPTGQPSSAPTTAPSSQPSTPTSVPSGQPTLAPSASPSAVPTHKADYVNTWAHTTEFSLVTLQNGGGIKFKGEHRFKQVGRSETTGGKPVGQWFLTAYVWDTGFGPANKEWINFYVNGEAIMQNGSQLACSPLERSLTKGCSNTFLPCFFNEDISDKILTKDGGSVTISTESNGVMNTPCPLRLDASSSLRRELFGGTSNDSSYEDTAVSLVYVKYELTTIPRDTPLPTHRPTPSPTKGSITTNNGLQLDVNELDIWQLLQISIAVGVALAALAVYLCKLREKSEEVYKHPLPFAVVSLGMLGMELTSMAFLIVNLFTYGYGGSGAALLAFRFIKMCIAGVLLLGVFRPPSTPILRKTLDFTGYIDHDHFVESKIYFIVAAMCVVDLTFVLFLPWRDSKFATLSKGFPNIVVFRLVQLSLIITAMISFFIQVSYLVTTPFSVERDLMFVMNITLLAIKLVLILLEYVYKSSKLGETMTAIETKKDGDVELASFDGSKIDDDGGDTSCPTEMVFESNPMHITMPTNSTSESAPLLERMDAIEREQQAQNQNILEMKKTLEDMKDSE